jgi:hypothetical protein
MLLRAGPVIDDDLLPQQIRQAGGNDPATDACRHPRKRRDQRMVRLAMLVRTRAVRQAEAINAAQESRRLMHALKGSGSPIVTPHRSRRRVALPMSISALDRCTIQITT